MATGVKRRRYDASRRQQAAVETRRRVLEAARRRFLKQGYAATSMQTISDDAGVALDTVYASVGRKPELFRLLLETAISGTDDAVPSEERDYVRRIQAEPDAARKLDIYARAIRDIAPRFAPLVEVAREASAGHPDVGSVWRDLSRRRARRMRDLAGHLADTGALRAGLSVDEAGDVLWSLNAPEFYRLLLVERGWSLDRFEHWLADAWKRLLLG
ncbi:MAG: TetR/AcrR family transcriptional regulator [Candidatus Dormibacteria bacterium]